jgi:septal ring-binding cell division protein DamX/type II secretory pathway predicted ATPase ExeA
VKIDGRTAIETLGLPKNPFGEAIDEFFADGDRGRQLDELRHLARWSRRLLVVTGERGVGKSTLYRALSSRLDPGVKAARINANLTSDTREVLAGIIQGFGMAAPANADPRLLIELISLHVHEQIDANRYCLVLIDDAHLLELRALEQLLKLVDAGAEEGLRIVFFAETYFVQSLDKASKRSEHGPNWHEIRLSPFTAEEARRYVAFRLKAAGHEGNSPFSPNQLSVIVGGSSGLPGRIDELASAILTGQLRINDDRGLLPRMHRALAVLVLIGAGMGWLIFYSEGESRRTSQTTADATPPSGGTAASARIERVIRGDASTLALAVPSRDAANESRPTGDITEPARIAADPAKTTVANRIAEAAKGEVQSTPTAPSTPDPPDRQPPKSVLVKSKSDASNNAPPKAAPAQLAEPARTSSGGAAPLSSNVGRPQSAQWLRQQPGGYFTLQLFATTSRAKRDAFISQQEHPDRFATFETRRNGEAWYAVTYGAYATQAEAKSAAATLPSGIGVVQPWVRTFASVQATLE